MAVATALATAGAGQEIEGNGRAWITLLQVLFCTGQVAGMATCEHDGRATCQALPTHGTSVLPI